MRIKQILESVSVGGMGTGSIATAPAKAGKMIKREKGNLLAQEDQDVAEISTGDYYKKATMQRAQAGMGAGFARSPEEREKNLAIYNKRDKGLNRLKDRNEKARAADQQKQMADLVARLPELEAEYERMRAEYKSLGGSDWQYADREQNLTPGERKARDMEGPMNNIWRQIQAAKKHQGVAEGLRGTGNPGMPTPYDQGLNDAKKGRAYDNPYDQSGEEQEHIQYKKGYEQGKKPGVAAGSERVYNILALDKGNALKKPTKLKWKASSLEDIFDALAAQDWYPLEINGVEVIAGKRLKQGVAEGDKKPHPKTWHDVDPKLGKQVDKMTQAEKVKKGLAHPNTLKKKELEEYGDTARGQKMLTKVQKRAVDCVTSKRADTDPKYAKKNKDTADRAWDRMTDKDLEENKKGVRAVKHTTKAKGIEAPKPRNFVAKNAKMGGAGAHKDKKKAQKQGDTKHKAKEPAYESRLWAALERKILK